jgi:hypothetical protein
MAPSSAVVSTQRGVKSTLDSFLRWHLDGAHFDHVYIYVDDPRHDVDALAAIRADPHWQGRVTLLEATDDFRLRENYEQLPSWNELEASVKSMVQSRQRLNCEHCARLCAKAATATWLLHIDADELWMPGAEGADARSHFARLEDYGCWQFTYRNLEAVPTDATDGRGGDYFSSVSVFKQHEDALPAGALEAVGSAAHDALAFWLRRTHARIGHTAWFLFYSNGKSAVRIDADWRQLMCAGVHGWGCADVASMVMGQRARGWRTNIRKLVERQRSALRVLDGKRRTPHLPTRALSWSPLPLS